MTDKNHIHKLKRHRHKSGNVIFFCALPDCKFKSNIALVLGKRSICWRCGNHFIMSDYALKLAKPHCESCHHPKKQIEDKVNEVYSETPQQETAAERLAREMKSILEGTEGDI